MIILINEATTKYVKKHFDPALLTFNEFYKAFNIDDKSHPNNAYITSLENLNNYYSDFKSTFNHVLQRFSKNGLKFEVRLEKEKVSYAKINSEGDIVRDEKGHTMSFTDEELKQLNVSPYSYTIIISHENKIVGMASDEWGAVLIRVAEEYRGMNFGKILLDFFMEYYPHHDSGGFTPDGYKFIKKYHAQKVKEYLAKGIYSYLIRQNIISKEKVQKIIAEIPQLKKRKEVNLNYDEPNLILYMDLNDIEYIIYHGLALKKLNKNYSYEYFDDKLIKGHIRFMPLYTEKNTVKMQILYAINQEYLKELLEMSIQSLYKNKIKVKVDENSIKYLNAPRNQEYFIPNPSGNKNYSRMFALEKVYRKKYDKYDEGYSFVIEKAYDVSESNNLIK